MLSKFVKKKRKEKEMSQQALANEAKVHLRSVQTIEKGVKVRPLTRDKVLKQQGILKLITKKL